MEKEGSVFSDLTDSAVLAGGLTSSSFQNSLTGGLVAGSFKNPMQGCCDRVSREDGLYDVTITGTKSRDNDSGNDNHVCCNHNKGEKNSGNGHPIPKVKRKPPSLLASRFLNSSKQKSPINRGMYQQLCQHCNKLLGEKALKRHKKLYLKKDGAWIKEYKSLSDDEDEDILSKAAPKLPTFHTNRTCDMEYEDNTPTEQIGSSDESSEDFESDAHEMWDATVDMDDEVFTTEKAPSLPSFTIDPKSHDIVVWLVAFLLSLQAKHYIPDAAIGLLINFLHVLFFVLSTISPNLKPIYNLFPKSLPAMLKLAGCNYSYSKFTVCCKCNSIYEYASCVELIGSQRLSRKCQYVAYPEHPQHSRRKICNSLLLKSVELSSGHKFLYPFKFFCYNSVKSSLQKLFLQPSFVNRCTWKTKVGTSSLLCDVYDGAIWNKFYSMLHMTTMVGLMLNIDWFQPFSHTVCSVGVIYLTIMNLPRHLRNKRENIILVGIIPGPEEPKHDINTFLKPLVSELNLFWKGQYMKLAMEDGVKEKIVKCALLCVSCDLPAVRKTCGFLSHSAAFGCSKCMKKFSGSAGCMDYSGFNCSEWPKRNNNTHRISVQEIQACKTKTTKEKKESELGCRYSALLDLPYFDAVRMHVIDPMHNLYLGTGKHMINTWIKHGYLAACHFGEIQAIVDSIKVPLDVGRIPRKIESGFCGFKADQFKNWITTFSIPALFGILPKEQLECWRHFVLGCRILCKQSLSHHDINLADALLVQFCKKVEALLGPSAITPNMHMHAHIKDVILDYGPLQEYWCYSFERFNGILGKQPNNNKSIEIQLMDRFLRDNSIYSIQYPETYSENFKHFVEVCTENKVVGSSWEYDNTQHNTYKMGCKYTRAFLDPSEQNLLRSLLMKMDSQCSLDSEIAVNSVYFKYDSVTINHKEYRSSGKKQTPSVAMAIWDRKLYGSPPSLVPISLVDNANTRPVNIHYFMKVIYSINSMEDISSTKHNIFAYCSWFFPHTACHDLGKPVQIWCNSVFESSGLHTFLPLDKIVCRCAHGVRQHKTEQVKVIIPLPEN